MSPSTISSCQANSGKELSATDQMWEKPKRDDC